MSSVPPPSSNEPSSAGDERALGALTLELLQRLDSLETRLARIESTLGIEAAGAPAGIGSLPRDVIGTAEQTTPAPSLPAPSRSAEAPASLSPRPGATSASDRPPPSPRYGALTDPTQSRWRGKLWGWLTGGNALTRVGIVILFFGVAFLLRYFGEIVVVPIELKLAAMGAGGIALAGLGMFLARRRPAYGLSLQGAGMGIVYLTVFAAFRLYEVLAAAPTIGVLVLVAAGTIVLALRHDSRPLAALALAGGFLAPMLIRIQANGPVLLFGYFAILNGVVFALAWKRAWRPLNVLGFVFTFVLGAWWGWQFYRTAHYATVQPFLILFFAYYLGIAILYARRSALDVKAPVDGILVFGVPIVGFALQMAIVRSHRYGVAWSAGALSVLYAGLWLALRQRAETGLSLLARAFAALAVIFATLAIPFAVDPRATSAWWALEAAAVYWLGVVQRQPVARWFALLLQLGAGAVFAIEFSPVEGRLLLNANFIGTALIGLAGLASAWAGDRYPDRLQPRERSLAMLVLCWAVAWWMLGGVAEMQRQIAHPAHIDAALAWIVGSTALALLLQRWLRWPRLGWSGALLLPAMAFAALDEFRAERTTLTYFGWLVWPIAWFVQAIVLRVAETLRGQGDDRQRRTVDDVVRHAHTVTAIALVAWTAWEASEWVGRWTAEGTVWIACAAAVPAIAYLLGVVYRRDSARWPLRPYASAYGASAGMSVAALLSIWLVFVNAVSPGDPSPLPYAPIANPLDLTLLATLGALGLWARVWGHMDERTRFGGLAAAGFVSLSGAVVRSAHHWGDVPWRFAALMASKPLQTALTLTWTATALALMLWAARRAVRAAWMVGAVLLAAVVVKLFTIDLAALSGLTRVIAFMGVGMLLLVIGYVAPLPPGDSTLHADRGR